MAMMSEPMAEWERQILEESDVRHHKWHRVEPGHVIPAGQPYRIEWPVPKGNAYDALVASERICYDHDMRALPGYAYFVDSSWKPPLVLPTEPTWGIALCRDWHRGVSSDGWIVDKWHLSGEWFKGHETASEYDTSPDESGSNVIVFIPLTDEQIARIEAAR